jgi:putative addiction module component (TIGR02574 family)
MILEKLPSVQALSIDDKERLAEEIWEEVSAIRDTLPVPQEHLDILEQRRAEYEANPKLVKSWDEVKAGLKNKFGELG